MKHRVTLVFLAFFAMLLLFSLASAAEQHSTASCAEPVATQQPATVQAAPKPKTVFALTMASYRISLDHTPAD